MRRLWCRLWHTETVWTRLEDGERVLQCVDCQRVIHLDLRDHPAPIAVGAYDEAQAVAARRRAEHHDRLRRALAAQRSTPQWAQRTGAARGGAVIDISRRARLALPVPIESTASSR